MQISSFRVQNFKSFLDTGAIVLTDGFNVVVGRNNSGKSALLEALSLQAGTKPHRSETTARTAATDLTNPSVTTLVFEMTSIEFATLLMDYGHDLHYPLSRGSNDPKAEFDSFVTKHLLADPLLVELTYRSDGSFGISINGEPLQVNSGDTNASTFVFQFNPQTNMPQWMNPGKSRFEHHLPYVLTELLKQRLYLFKAIRASVGVAPASNNPRLESNGSNLSSVLHELKIANDARWTRYCDLVRKVLPEITQISIESTSDNTYGIRIWNHEPASERRDLAFPLEESGTGVGQVLAILYVAVTSEFPQIFLIDEPQSFLHPDVIGSLFSVLRNDIQLQHQYVLSTHAPNVIADAEPGTVLQIKKEGFESSITALDVAIQSEVRACLTHLGARLSDVFGMNEVLWVEGATEEQCLPLVIRHFGISLPPSTAILGVVSTGDFEGKKKAQVIDVYKNLSGQRSLLPPALAFVFDDENRTEAERMSIKGKAPDEVHFLPRKMYENYLIHPECITDVINDALRGAGNELVVTVDEVRLWIEDNKWDPRYVPVGEEDEGRWLKKVDGSKFLDAMFNQLSCQTLTYDDYKIEYGRRLTECILNTADRLFVELRDFLNVVLLPKPGAAV